ncbi:2147_t:CDS:2 [Ambispora leptoticha]|uniref:2147_t:CDS:1 n=1 Tax=Ambispora leptoticha TaxID=144679 RepID=A0A9N8V8K5_9GLOM|nr:2147_t:CDS:2 [Ambispora leptoticha]
MYGTARNSHANDIGKEARFKQVNVTVTTIPRAAPRRRRKMESNLSLRTITSRNSKKSKNSVRTSITNCNPLNHWTYEENRVLLESIFNARPVSLPNSQRNSYNSFKYKETKGKNISKNTQETRKEDNNAKNWASRNKVSLNMTRRVLEIWDRGTSMVVRRERKKNQD